MCLMWTKKKKMVLTDFLLLTSFFNCAKVVGFVSIRKISPKERNCFIFLFSPHITVMIT